MMDLMPKKFYLDDIFDDFMPEVPRKDINMKCDIYEKKGVYHIDMDVPGFDKKDINLEAKDGYLTIRAHHSEENNEEDKDKKYIRRERVSGTYERSFYLGDLDQEKIDAEFKNGMLKITVPKKEVIDNKKVIEIK